MALSLLALVITLALSFTVFAIYPQVGALATRTTGIFQSPVAHFVKAAPYVAFVTMICSTLYAVITLFLIYYFF